MATIGLDKLYYAPITEDENGEEIYGTPVQLAKAMSADLTVEIAEATLYADDGAAEIVKEFKSGTLSLGVDDIGASVAAALTGVEIDANHVAASLSPPPPSKAPSFAGTRWTAEATIPGRRRSLRATRALPLPLPRTGISRCMSLRTLPLPTGKEARLWIRNAAPTLVSAVRHTR